MNSNVFIKTKIAKNAKGLFHTIKVITMTV